MKAFISKSQYMKGVKSLNDKNKVTKAYKRLLSQNNLTTGPLNKEKRELLSEAIFEIENELEHKSSGIHHEKTQTRIHQLNNARNLLYDHLRWNERN